MSQFLDIHLPEYVESCENIEEASFGTVCICCLSHDNVFINLISCKHSGFLECYFKYKLEYPNNYVCIFCHKMLQKIYDFRHQVEECMKVLNQQIPNLEKKTNLQVSQIEITSLESKEDCKSEGEDTKYEIATDVKIEHDSSGDLDVPLAEVKKKVRKKKKKHVKSEKQSKKRSTVEQKYDGKLRTVNLTKKEMLDERQELSQEQKYLRLPYKCEDCIVAFEFEMAWKSHVSKQHDKTGFKCDLCKSVMASTSSLKEHWRRHSRRYECSICKKRYRDENSAVEHYNELHGATGAILVEFQCTQCDFTTRSHRRLRYHRSKHKNGKVKCALCESEFINKSGLRIHMYTLHKQSSREHACAACGKQYGSRSGLFAHARLAHGAARRAYCLACRAHYRTPRHLAHHLRTHSRHVTDAERRFGCDDCGARFISKSTLKGHIEWEHLAIRDNKCVKCAKVFRSKTILKKHIEFVHEKKRPPRNKICDYCGQGFTTAAILRSHIRTHTGERPHRCVHCGATFAHSSALYNHNKLLHRAERDRR